VKHAGSVDDIMPVYEIGEKVYANTPFSVLEIEAVVWYIYSWDDEGHPEEYMVKLPLGRPLVMHRDDLMPYGCKD
jgi:hypothetical protein